ncbi:MAG: hypothetical protein OEY67_10285, partial [Gammaproteobacteria bacterium]|nr:hypothetical protein [Gammaproteobacteria bacterium]
MPLILDTASARPDDNFAVIECAHLIYVPDFRSTKRSAIVAIADSLAGRSDSGEAARCATETLR